jgi:SAM-dependent methyltransferase
MNKRLEENQEVIAETSPKDQMFKSDPKSYFFWGAQGLETIKRFMSLLAISTVSTVLDFPSGYGRVLRFLRAAYPDAEITACDIDRDGVDFCAKTFNAQPVYSTVDMATVPILQAYDLIWCGSLLTHIHAAQWRELLELFSAHLSDSGALIFTTHGRPNAERLRAKRNVFDKLGLSDWAIATILSDYERCGFGYQNYSAQEGYGVSLSSPSWVCSQVIQTSGLRLVAYQEGGWGGIQDAVACVSERRALR